MLEFEDYEEDEIEGELWNDYVRLKTGDALTSGSDWNAIVQHLLEGRKVYHRYSFDFREENEEQWIKDSLTRILPKEKIPLLAIEELDKGEFYNYLNTIPTPDDEDFYPEDTYYCVWYLRPNTNAGALGLLKKEELNIDSMRKWLDEQRIVETNMGEDIWVD
jgi:hypothetical protein